MQFDTSKYSNSGNFDLSGSNNSRYNDILEKQSMASNGVGFNKASMAEQMPVGEASGVGVGGGVPTAGAATNLNPYIAGASMALDVVNKYYDNKNKNLMTQYQAKLQDYNNRQAILQRMGEGMKV